MSAPQHALPETIIVAASGSHFPYSYRDEAGHLTGFACELTDAVARAMNLRVERKTVTSVELARALMSGQVDVAQFWSETDERRLWADFSVPLARFETVAVVRRDDRRFRSMADLAGKRVAVGQVGTVADRYLKEQQPRAEPVYTTTSEHFLRMLSAGDCDAAVMARGTALAMIDHFGLTNLKVIEGENAGEAYVVRYCFTVRKGNALLLSRLNEGIAIVQRSGEYDRIYRAWFSRYERLSFTKEQMMGLLAATVGVVFLVSLGAYLWQRHLSQRAARQAAELDRQRSLLAAVYEKHPMATLVLEFADGVDPRIVSHNPEARRLFGLDPDVVGQSLARLAIAPEWRAYLADIAARSGGAGAPSRWERAIPETRQLVSTTLVPLDSTLSSGRHRVCVFSADITRQRFMDQELALSQRLRALGELVGGIAHEFNNLLTPVIATTSMLQADYADDPDTLGSLSVIDEAAQRAAQMTRRLLAFGRKGAGDTRSARVADVVANCFALLQPTIDRRVVWEMHVPDDLPPVRFNPTDLNQVFFNLIIHARDALLERLATERSAEWTPRITVHADVPSSDIDRATPATPAPSANAWQHVTVIDNGAGIPARQLERVFEPFATASADNPGSGWGLAAVWRLVTDSGGSVSIESRVGEGTRVHLVLPRQESSPRATDVGASGNRSEDRT